LPHLRRTLRRAGHLGVLSLFTVLAPAQAAEAEGDVADAGAEALTNADCFECHLDPTLTRTVQGQSVALAPLVRETFEASVHGALNCVDCHAAITELVH